MEDLMNDTLKPPKFLVCVDGHDESMAALKFACLKAKTRGAIVDIIHVMPPADFQTLGIVADRMNEERREAGEKLLRRLRSEAEQRYGVSPDIVLREGNTGDELLAFLNEIDDISVLIVGSAHHMKGRGKLAGWLAGQLGQKLFVPLVMVPGNLTDEQLEGLM
jgi:nucleotide-binding universal stress UspA family protein